MSKLNISFNGANYSIDESAFSESKSSLQSYLSSVMNGTGATIYLGGVAYNIDSAKLSTATTDFISHLGTIAGSGSKVVVNGVEYSIGTDKVSGAVSELEIVFNDLKGEVSQLTYGCTVEDGDYIYTYLGTTLAEERNAMKSQLEAETGMSWDDIVSQYANGDEEALWEMLGVTEETFVPVEPSWTVQPINKNITGSNPIKGEVEGAPVTIIGKDAFSGCINLTSITIPNTVTNIEGSAFYGCSALTSIIIPDSVTNIAANAFDGCSALTSIIIPDSVGHIGSAAFRGCSSLDSITIPFVGTTAGVQSGSASSVFGYIFGTTNYTGGVATTQHYDVSSSTYYIPASLKSVTITGGRIAPRAFEACTNLANITIGNGVTTIGSYAFYGCTSLTSVTIPNSVTSIERFVFHSCTSLTSVTIPDSVTTIGEGAFMGCSSLTNITIPDSVTSIGTKAFYGCSKTQEYVLNINFEGSVAQWANVTLNSEWNLAYTIDSSHIYITEVICTDGQVTL